MKDVDSKLYSILSHPIRREIIILLGDRGALRAKELKEHLNIGSGLLYYHLNNMRGVVTQNENKEYILTSEGRKIYNLIISGDVPADATDISFYSYNPILKGIATIVFPKNVFNYVLEDPKRHVIEFILIILIGGYASYQSNFMPLLLIPVEATQSLFSAFLNIFITLFALFVLSDFLVSIVFRRRGGHLKLFIGVILSFAPIVFFFSVILLDDFLGMGLRLLMDGWLLRLLMLLCQLYSLTLLSTSVSVSKGLSIDKASMIGLIIAYISIFLYVIG